MEFGAEQRNKDRSPATASGKVAVGHPVDVASGTLFHKFNDYTLPGRLPIAFNRRYSTSLLTQNHRSLFGKGWSSPFEVTLDRQENGFIYRDESGEDEIFFALPEAGLATAQPLLNAGSFTELTASDSEYCVTRWDPDSGQITRDFFLKSENSILPLKLSRREDESCNAVEFLYAAGTGLLEFIIQKREQRGFQLFYDNNSRLVEVRRKSRQSNEVQKKEDNKPWLQYQYNTAGMLATFTDPLGKRSHYKYDAEGRMISEITLAGKEWRFVFDEQGRCVVTTSKNKFDYHKLDYGNKGRVTRVEDSYGNVTQYHYNEVGQVTKEVSPLGHIKSTVFDGLGRIAQEITPAGNATSYAYDEAGNRQSITFADGASVHYLFNDKHLPLSLTDPTSSIWQRNYDQNGRTVSQINPAGAEQHFEYNRAGDIVSHTDAGNNTRQFQWDSYGNVTKTSDWEGNDTSCTWDRYGALVSIIDPQGHTTQIHRDKLGRVRSVTLADGNQRHYQWDVFDNLTEYTDEKKLKTQWHYCDCGNLEQEVRADGSSIFFGWNAIPGQLAAVTNQNNEVFHFSYDADGRLIEEQDFTGSITRYERDADGRVVKTIKPSGKVIEFEYGRANRVSRILYSSGDETTFRYDTRGLLIEADNGQCPIAFEYDELGRVIREAQGEHEIINTYDLFDRRTARHSDQGESTSFQWTPNGQISQVHTNGFAPINFDYDHRGFEKVREFASISLNNKFNERGLLAEQVLDHAQSRRITSRQYEYDAAGNLTRKNDEQWGTTRYVYDELERITQTLHPDKTIESFSYDLTDNINAYARKLAENVSPGDQESWIYEKGNRMVKKEDVTFSYDQDGQLIERTNREGKSRFYWNDAGQLASVKTTDGTVWKYTYDALGRRVAKECPTEKREFHWDGDVVLSDIKHKNETVQRDRWEYHPYDFSPLFKVQDDKQYLCVNDQIGTPMELVNEAGVVEWSHRSWTFGETKEFSADSVTCDIRFQGQWFDGESGLCYNRFRYYDAEASAYVSNDPIGLLGGYNQRAYCINTTKYIDPLGLTQSSGKCAKEVIEEVRRENPELCELHRCVEFADAAQAALEAEGITGTRVRIDNAGAIGFDDVSISQNGVHVFIDVDGLIYDNLSTAVPREEYLRRLAVSNRDREVKPTPF